MLVAAGRLQPTAGSPLMPAVLRIALVLLYTAGLRRGELLRLTLADVEPTVGRATDCRFEVPQVSMGAAVAQRPHGTSTVSARASCRAARCTAIGTAALQPQPRLAQLYRARPERGHPQAVRCRRCARQRGPTTPDSRSSPQLCHRSTDPLVSRGRRPPGAVAQARDVHGARLDRVHGPLPGWMPEVAALASARFETPFGQILRSVAHECPPPNDLADPSWASSKTIFPRSAG